MKHLTLEELIACVDPSLPEDGKASLAGHLAGCAECRDRLVSIHSLRSAGARLMDADLKSPKPLPVTADCPPMETMGDYLGGRLPADERAKYATHMAWCDACFERATYFTSSAIKMAAGVLVTPATPEKYLNAAAPAPTRMGIGRKLMVALGNALKSPVPAYAFAAVLALFMFLGDGWFTGGELIPLKSDSNFTIYVKPDQAGASFGFPDAGGKVAETPAGLRMKISGGDVHFSWNAVDGAKEYGFTLLEITPRGLKDVFGQKTGNPEISVSALSLLNGSAYRYKVTGVNNSDQVFSAAGQFAFNK
ncbi:MAG: zf-HC2 domain-containing protein [Nitrospinae bacterium]|nr:zf-HC2 domain-containing protein [Nitrospinota bacterium]